jgi:hypothetical protein
VLLAVLPALVPTEAGVSAVDDDDVASSSRTRLVVEETWRVTTTEASVFEVLGAELLAEEA